MMQSPEEKEKFDQLSTIIDGFVEIAERLGVKYKVAGDPHPFEGRPGVFQLKRYRSVWSVVWSEDGEEKRLQDCSLAVKRLFLQNASRFFGAYIEMAKEWESTVDDDLDAGAKALADLRRAVEDFVP